jgi:hypothetical protein
MLDMLCERHKINRDRIKSYAKKENVDGSPISYGHASTALSNTRKEQLVVELLMEIVVTHSQEEIQLSERAEQGFRKLVTPQERHFDSNGNARSVI